MRFYLNWLKDSTELTESKANSIQNLLDGRQEMKNENKLGMQQIVAGRHDADMAGEEDEVAPLQRLVGGKSVADALALAQGQAQADMVVIEDMNHILKRVEQDDRAANLATYADSSLPIHPDLIDALARYLGQDRN